MDMEVVGTGPGVDATLMEGCDYWFGVVAVSLDRVVVV